MNSSHPLKYLCAILYVHNIYVLQHKLKQFFAKLLKAKLHSKQAILANGIQPCLVPRPCNGFT